MQIIVQTLQLCDNVSGAVAQLQVVELMVPLCCTKCEEKVKKALLEMEGEPQLLHLKINHQKMRNVL